MNKEAETKMIRARIALLKTQGFFGTLALRLQMVEDSKLDPPTMAVDGTTLFYHPQFVLDQSFDDVVFIVAHEVLHCVFDHMGRVAAREPDRWNTACDYAINPILVDSGFHMPQIGGLLDRKYDNMSADQIYNLLPQQPPGTKPKLMDRVKQAPKGKDAQAEKDGWEIAVVQAANAAKKAGTLPGSLQRLVDEIIEPKTDWRAELRAFVTEVAKNDYSWQRLNRRYISMGFYLPGLYSENMGTMAAVTDDSGSIGDPILQLFAGEIESIREQMRPERTLVISCDARVNHVDDLTMDDVFKMQCHGGGGTDFRPPFKWLEQHDITPACLVYLTDLEGPFPAEPPPYPVLWCSINKKKAPWGKTIHIEPRS